MQPIASERGACQLEMGGMRLAAHDVQAWRTAFMGAHSLLCSML